MMTEDHPNRIVELIGVKRNRHVLSFIRHQLDRKIDRDAEYRITITHDREIGGFSCRVHVRANGHDWSGYDTGKTLEASLERTLRHLHEEYSPEPAAPVPRSA